MEFATDINNVMYAYIDRKKKFPVTTLLRSIGFETDKDILELFGMAEEIPATKKELEKHIGRKLAARVLRTWVEDFVDEDTGEVVSIERNEIVMERDSILDLDGVDTVIEMEIKSLFLQREDVGGDYAIIYNTLNKDTSNSELEAVQHIYRQLRGWLGLMCTLRCFIKHVKSCSKDFHILKLFHMLSFAHAKWINYPLASKASRGVY